MSILTTLEQINSNLAALNLSIEALGDDTAIVAAINGVEMAIGRADSGIFVWNGLDNELIISVASLSAQKVTAITATYDLLDVDPSGQIEAMCNIPYISGIDSQSQTLYGGQVYVIDFTVNDEYLSSAGSIEIRSLPAPKLTRVEVIYER